MANQLTIHAEKRKNKLLLILSGIITLCIILVCVRLFFPKIWLAGESIVYTLSLGHESYVKITMSNYCEVSCSYCYQIFLKEAPLTRQYFFGASVDNPQFEILASKDGDVVALIEKSVPDVVFMFYEFSTKNNYPGNGTLNGNIRNCYEGEDETVWEEKISRYYRTANKVIAKIAPDLILSDQVSGRRAMKIY